MPLEAAGQAVLDERQRRAMPARDDAAPPPGRSDVIRQIKELGELHAAGVLTDEEFSTKKTELLKRI